MRTYIHTDIHTYTHTYIHTSIHTYIHTSMHACMHTYIYIQILHTHIYIHRFLPHKQFSSCHGTGTAAGSGSGGGKRQEDAAGGGSCSPWDAGLAMVMAKRKDVKRWDESYLFVMMWAMFKTRTRMRKDVAIVPELSWGLDSDSDFCILLWSHIFCIFPWRLGCLLESHCFLGVLPEWKELNLWNYLEHVP